MRDFTREEIERLKEYEAHFETAVKANWSRYPGRDALKVIHAIYCDATGDTRRFSDDCGQCIVRLLRDCGKKYYADSQKAVTVAKVVRKRKK